MGGSAQEICIEVILLIIIQEGEYYLVNTLVDFLRNQEDFELAGGFLPVDSGQNPPAGRISAVGF